MKQETFFTSSVSCTMLHLLLFVLGFGGTVHSKQDLSDPLADLVTYYETLNYSTLLLAEAHARIKKSFDPEETLHLNFKAHGRSFNLQLRRDRNLFADGLEFDTSSGFHPNNFYEGTLKGEKNSQVHGYVHNDIFEGKIYLGDGNEFHIESSQKYPQMKDCHSYIYDAKHVIHPKQYFCGGRESVRKNEFQDNVTVSKGPKSNNDDLIKVHHRERRATRFDSSRTECHLYMRADYTYSEWTGGDVKAMLQMANHVKAVSHIYEMIDFNNDNIKEEITFRIKKLDIIPKCSEGENTNICEFSKESIDPHKFLDIASIGNFGAYCLSYVFAHRNFNGVLGIAYIGRTSSFYPYGICGKVSFRNEDQGETFNTGFVTNLASGREYIGKVTDIIFAHEIGHNFGAQHDTFGSCSPGGDEGNFIMYPRISSGIYPNSFLFSQCSKRNMWSVIQNKGGCFVAEGSPICGNKVIEGSEECDCGYSDEESCSADKCCIGRAPRVTGTGCKYSAKAKQVSDLSLRCSPSNGLCCDVDKCSPFTNGKVCADKTDCAGISYCDSTNKECPLPSKVRDTALCNHESNVCVNGTCTGSLCLTSGLQQCLCPSRTDWYRVCCRDSNDNSCTVLNPSSYMPQATCHGTFHSDNGTIASPNYPSNYNNQLSCKYSITVSLGKRIQFEILDAEFENTLCQFDYLSFQENQLILGKYCATGNVVYTRGNQLEIYFVTDGSITAKGFKGRWSSCNQNVISSAPNSCAQLNSFNSDSGTITSPNYPLYHQKKLYITYIITVSQEKRIQFEITNSYFKSLYCRYNYLLFKDNSKVYGKHCESGDVIYTTGNTLEVYFITNKDITSKGFLGRWHSFEKATCGGNFFSDTGRIASPNYPLNYDNNLNCIYTINVAIGKRITFEILDAKLQNSLCIYDYLLFRERGTTLGKYCNTGNVVYTKGNQLEIRFVTSYFGTAKGFMGRWSSCYNVSQVNDTCGRFNSLNSDSGTIMSPNYPLNYQNNLNITYIITVSLEKRIRFTISYMNLEYSLSCRYDYLLFKENSRVLGKYCLSTGVIVTSGNTLEIVFVTDGAATRKGFQGKWNSIERATCGGNFFSDTGRIASPNYPLKYDNNLNCLYTINVAIGKRIKFEILDAKLQNSLCIYDYLLFRERGTTLGKYCNTGNVVYTRGNQLEILFVTNGWLTAKGFMGRWSSCDSVSQINDTCVHFNSFNSDSGTIVSPNYPLNYQNNLDITYKITVLLGKKIRFTISYMNLLYSSTCRNDYLLFKEKSKTLGKYCTSTHVIVTSGNTLEIVFVTDGIGAGRGFRGIWNSFKTATTRTTRTTSTSPATSTNPTPATSTTSSVTVPCGGSFYSDNGTITSPNYPSKYNNNLNCRYNIIVSKGKRIRFQIVNAEFENTFCQFNYLSFQENQLILGKYCTTGTVVYTRGNQLEIHFVTDGSGTAKSFIGSWSSSFPVFSATSTEDSKTVSFATGISVPLVLLLIAFCLFCFYRRMRKTKRNRREETPTDNAIENKAQSGTQFAGIGNSIQTPSENPYLSTEHCDSTDITDVLKDKDGIELDSMKRHSERNSSLSNGFPNRGYEEASNDPPQHFAGIINKSPKNNVYVFSKW